VIQTASVVDQFHVEAYNAATDSRSWGGATWMGIKTWKWPGDLQLYQELIWDLKPRLIIETGTAFGGSALFFAHMLDQIGAGKVVTIDRNPMQRHYPMHPRIVYLDGRSSVDPGTVADVSRYYDTYGQPTLMILDSDHARDHVLAELKAYASFVAPASYLVVEDTNVNGHPVYQEHGPGPQEALDEWLPKHQDFKVDERRAVKYLFSMHTWLRRQRV
jgi:cephalosporin hydroxylase